MKIFLLLFSLLIFLGALLHLPLLLKKDTSEFSKYNLRDKTYWAILLTFISVVASIGAEVWHMVSFTRTPTSWVGTILVLASFYWTLRSRSALGKNYSPTAQNNDPEQTLVRAGPYRFVKHPMYFGNLVTVVGLFLAFNLKWAWFSFPLFLLAMLWRIHDENRFLRKKFADALPE